ncbi:hypothetical protein [Streptomyces sp. NPDC054804]
MGGGTSTGGRPPLRRRWSAPCPPPGGRESRRARIAADRDKEVARINAASQGLRDYLDRVFGERRDLHRGFFARLDRAIEDRDPETVQACVAGIVEVTKHSPLNDIAELRSIWADPRAVIEI